MTCDHREPELLLLAHRELPVLRAVALRVHLSRCSHCRKRYRQLAGVSILLASALQTPGIPSWTPADVSLSPHRLLGSVSKRRVILWSALIATSALLMYGVFHTLSYRQRQEASQSETIRDTGCSPGLPNDLCR